ncbi:Lrp/AsnC family transcriptional regulator [Pannonibacter sp.]|uniref:Lrp/AsnC family transcriptional regulator n=1 Tax=Pannonibacter sp. TaxID=1906786 RepID=UPI003F703589
MDEIDRNILEALAGDARLPLKQLAEVAGLSGPATADRLRRLEQRGVLRGYTVDIDPAALGYTLEAVVRIRPLPGQLHLVQQMIQETPEVIECDKITGDDCFVARLFVRSIGDIDAILDRISDRAATSTSLVKSKVIHRRPPAF